MKEKYEKPELITETMALEIVKAGDCCTGDDALNPDPLYTLFGQQCGCLCDYKLYY